MLLPRPCPASLAILVAATLAGAAAHAANPPPAAPVEASPKPAASAEVPYELTRPARPPLVPGRPPPKKPPWYEEIEIGGDAVSGVRTIPSGDTSGVRYRPAIGFGLHARWEMLSFLQFTTYFVDLRHTLDFAPGALSVKSDNRPFDSQGSQFDIPRVHTFSFGARFQPMVWVTSRFRGWLSAGIGWGRLEFSRMTITPPKSANTAPFTSDARSDPFVEFPLGWGIGFELIPKWLSLEYEFNGSFIEDQGGTAVMQAQIFPGGRLEHIGGFPTFNGLFTNTLGLSLRL